MAESIRVDVLLHRLCLTRSRSEAKNACDSGAVRVAGRAAKASEAVTAGQTIELHFPRRHLELELLQLPPKSTSKKNAREMYRVVRDEEISLL